MSFVNIYSTTQSGEISIIKNLLERKAIRYNVQGETINSSAGIAASGIRGMEVQVQEEDRERAMQILADTGFLDPNSVTSKKLFLKRSTFLLIAALVLVLVVILIAAGQR